MRRKRTKQLQIEEIGVYIHKHINKEYGNLSIPEQEVGKAMKA